MSNSAVSWLVMVFVHGIKCAIFVKRSTTVRIESKPLEGGRSVMKSIEKISMDSQEWALVVISHMDDVEVFLIGNMYHNYEHNP